jgi:hypothetical protein
MEGRDKKGRFIKGYYTDHGFKKGHIPWSKGKHPSIETKDKISKALVGKSKGKENAIKGRDKISKSKLGEKNWKWKGGRYTSPDGYVYILVPTHPKINNRRGYIAEHQLVMEKMIGRYLMPDEIVHHKNKIRNDNRPENLALVTRRTNYGKVKCPFCQKEFIIK